MSLIITEKKVKHFYTLLINLHFICTVPLDKGKQIQAHWNLYCLLFYLFINFTENNVSYVIIIILNILYL